jgi:hypothetical protein
MGGFNNFSKNRLQVQKNMTKMQSIAHRSRLQSKKLSDEPKTQFHYDEVFTT